MGRSHYPQLMGFVTLAPEMTDEFVPMVEPNCVGASSKDTGSNRKTH
jgi:hypothetical protein